MPLFACYCAVVLTVQTQRRMESDRFLTQDFTPEAYTPEGMEWIEKTSMSDILRCASMPHSCLPPLLCNTSMCIAGELQSLTPPSAVLHQCIDSIWLT
jgi:hypothetical protein